MKMTHLQNKVSMFLGEVSYIYFLLSAAWDQKEADYQDTLSYFYEK